jgi:predicted permease
MIDRLPVADDEARFPFTFEGAPTRRQEELPLVARTAISPGFRSTMRIPLLAGRDFTRADSEDAAPVALVNEEAARRFWPGADPIGKRVTFVLPDGPSPYVTIVGVVGNTRNADIDELKLAQVYVPSTLSPERAMALVIRAADGAAPLSLVEPVRQQVSSIDPRQPIHDVTTMDQVIADDFAGGVVLATLLGGIGFVALCLAAAGIYGVVAYMVSQRTREIGVRIALGASPGRVQRLVFRQGIAPVAAGGLVGLIAAIFLASATAGAISTTAPRDPLNYFSVAVTIALVAAAALSLPAARASRVDPTIALRAE